MAKQLTKGAIVGRFGKEYVRLLRKNLWVQNYKKSKYPWDEEYEGLWLPDIQYLWCLIEAVIPVDFQQNMDVDNYIAGMVTLKKVRGLYIAKLSPKHSREGSMIKSGVSPEEALLKLFISFNFPGYSKTSKADN